MQKEEETSAVYKIFTKRMENIFTSKIGIA